MKLISHNDILNLNISPKDCYHWVEEMLNEKNDMILPTKTSIKPTDEIFYNIMPSILPKYSTAGVKVVSRYPARTPSLDSQVIIYNYESGMVDAILDGNFLTTMRTGAVAVHSIKLLAKENFKYIGLIGLGNQARATIKILAEVYPNKTMVLKLFKYKEQHELFADFIKKLPNGKNITIEYCETYNDTVKGCDVVISSVTYFSNDICEDDSFEDGCLVVPIHTRGFMNCDLSFDKIFADDTNHVKGFKYFNEFKSFAEISDVLSGQASGRENNEEKILAYNIGLSVHDIYFARKIYQMIILNDQALEVDLKPPMDKFWI